MESIRPDVVVSKSEKLSFFSPDTEENIYFKTIMNKEFTILHQDNDNKIVVWQRNKNWGHWFHELFAQVKDRIAIWTLSAT